MSLLRVWVIFFRIDLAFYSINTHCSDDTLIWYGTQVYNSRVEYFV